MKSIQARSLKAQQGGALLVALILIFMLSLLGVSSMRGSTLERRMATNSIQTATTFQGAESINELAINDTNNLTSALNVANINEVRAGRLESSVKVTVEYDLLGEVDIENSATVQFVGTSPAYGYSAGVDGFIGYMFVVESRASVDAVRANGGVTQGAYRIAPAP